MESKKVIIIAVIAVVVIGLVAYAMNRQAKNSLDTLAQNTSHVDVQKMLAEKAQGSAVEAVNPNNQTKSSLLGKEPLSL